MRVTRGLKSFSMYRVEKDFDVFLIDLEVAGVELRNTNNRYSRYFRTLSRMAKEYGIPVENLKHIDYVGRTTSETGKTTFILRAYIDNGKVSYAAIASFKPRHLRELETALIKSGWKRLFHVGIVMEHVKSA